MKLLAFIAILVASPLAAAPGPVYGTKADALSLEAMQNFGRCVVRYTPAGARKLLAMDYRTEAYDKAVRRLAQGHDRCMRPGAQLRYNTALFAGALAEALFEDRRTALPTADQVKTPLPTLSPLESMAMCTTLTDPAAVTGLLTTEVASERERQAIADLAPTLGACLSGADKAELNRPAIRAVLALAAWRIADRAGLKAGAK